MNVNKRQLAEIVGVSERSLTEWQRHGMPMVIDASRGLENQYSTVAVIKWLMERAQAGASKESQRERLDRIRADREELALSRDLEELAPREEYSEAWDRHIGACRALLLQLSDLVVPEIKALYGIDIDPDIIDRQVYDALGKLADYDDPAQPGDAPPDDGDGEDDAEDSVPPLGAAAEDDDAGMGRPVSVPEPQGERPAG